MLCVACFKSMVSSSGAVHKPVAHAAHLDSQGGLGHPSILDELGHNARHSVHGDGKADARPGASLGEGCRVDANHLARRVQQRAPAHSGILSNAWRAGSLMAMLGWLQLDACSSLRVQG